MQTITIAPPKRSWFSLLSWAIVLAVLVVSWQGAEMARSLACWRCLSTPPACSPSCFPKR